MNDIQRGILNLIRSAITKQPIPLPEGFCLADAEKLINSHQIHGLAYEGAVLCGIPKTDPVMGRLFQKYCQLIRRDHIQMTALKKVYDAFEENGIDYLPVKGCVLKELYPNPAMRTMGDADVLIRTEQYDTIKSLLQSLNYVEGTPYHHELPWSNASLRLELHGYLIHDYHVLEYKYFLNAWDTAVHTGSRRYDLSKEDTLLYVFAHYAKHYRIGGIGLRQIVDIWVWQKAHPSINMDIVYSGLEQMDLKAFYESTMETLRCWFMDGEETEKAAVMTQYIFSSGSWGSVESHSTASSLRESKNYGSTKIARRKNILQAIFPSANKLSEQFPVLNKASWLLPFFWCVRWIRTLLFRRKNIRKYGHRLAAASDQKIKTFEQSLDFVGLRVHASTPESF